MDKIYMTKEGYAKKLKEFEETKKLLKETSKNKIEAAYDGSGDTWHDNFTYEQLDLQETGLISRLESMQELLSNVELVEKKALDDNVVNLGDRIAIEICYEDGECEELNVVLDESTEDENAVTLSSPLGKVLYMSKIGDKCTYSVNGSTNTVIIKNKF